MSNPNSDHQEVASLRRKRLWVALAFPLIFVSMWPIEQLFKWRAWFGILWVVALVADLFVILVLNAKVRRASKLLAQSIGTPPFLPRLLTSIILAVVWFTLDAFFFQQGLISGLLILLAILWMTPSALVARRQNSPLLRFRAGRAAAYFLAGVAALGVIRGNSYLSSQRAETVIAAVRQYRQKYGSFPDRLGQITPEFLPSIPLARYAFMWNGFTYFKSGDSARLSYVIYPPFLRRVYSFQSGTWGELD